MINNEEIADVEGNFNMMVILSISYFYHDNEFGESIRDNKRISWRQNAKKPWKRNKKRHRMHN